MFKKTFFPIVLLVLAVCYSCTNEDFLSDQKPVVTVPEKDYSLLIDREILNLTEADAAKVALQYVKNNLVATRSIADYNVKEIKTVTDAQGTPLLYVVNYKDNQGFVIISATKKYYPVLAYSEQGNYNLNADDGSVIWFDEIKTKIEKVSLDSSALKDYHWMAFEKSPQRPPSTRWEWEGGDVYYWWWETIHEARVEFNKGPSKGGYVHPGYEEFYTIDEIRGYNLMADEQLDNIANRLIQSGFEPDVALFGVFDHLTVEAVWALIETTWHQREPYNNKVPNNYPAGCVPIAVAQMMNYHQWPDHYRWSAIGANYINNEHLQNFIVEVGSAVDVHYGPDGSSSDMPSAMSGFRSFDYSVNLSYTYDTGRIKEELKSGKPIYMTGQKQYGSGHAWICDGYRIPGERRIIKVYLPEGRNIYPELYTENPYKEYSLYDNTTSVSSMTYYHMNWGGHSNPPAWHLEDNVSVGGHNFRYSRMFLYVTPNR